MFLPLLFLSVTLLSLSTVSAHPHSGTTVKILTSTDGTKIYADATGNPMKQSIVFVHGGLLSGIVYDRLFEHPRLKNDFYLVRYDMRNFGRSDKPTQPEAYTQELMAADFDTVVKGFNLKKPVFVGWSLSAAIIADIAHAFNPLPILGAITIGGGPAYGPELAPLFVGPNGNAGDFFQNTNVTDAILVHQHWVNNLFLHPSKIPFSVRMQYIGQTFLQIPDTLGLLTPWREQSRARLEEVGRSGELKMKMLFGKDDQNVKPQPIVDFFRPLIKKLEYVQIEGGHAVFEDNESGTVDEIVKFVKRVSSKVSKPFNHVLAGYLFMPRWLSGKASHS
ncbi:hypothetical protein ONZ45_g6952 [Pleurotus djamor]|nr:hypothetical protein ONZ45_g6952 [Pleurotus djamor]